MKGEPSLVMTGAFCVYFNKHADFPLVWSICPDPQGYSDGRWPAWELEVCDVVFKGADVMTQYQIRDKPDDETGLPSAYLRVQGDVNVRNGVAFITPVTARAEPRDPASGIRW